MTPSPPWPHLCLEELQERSLKLADSFFSPSQTKLRILINCMPAEVYELIEDCQTHDYAKN